MKKTTAFLLCTTALAASVTGASASRLSPMMSSRRTPAAPHLAVTALHAGKVVNKTAVPHVAGATHVTYTFGVYSSQSASSVNQNIYGTFYKWNSAHSGSYTICSNPTQKLKTPKKTVFGGTKASTETYSFGCASGPTVFHGDAWTNNTGVAGDVDTWRSVLKGKFIGPSGGKYMGTLNLDVNLAIGPYGVLYSQNSNDSGNSIISSNFTSSSSTLSAYDSQSADDFVVPAGHKWQVTEVDVTGVYNGGSGGGPATSENVFFYSDKGGLPGKLKTECDSLHGTDNGTGSFQISLPGTCQAKLKPGRYWVSVQVNMDFAVGGYWSWEVQTTQEGDPAAWQNPGDGFGTGCTTYRNQFDCMGVHRPIPGGGDQFTLKGKDN